MLSGASGALVPDQLLSFLLFGVINSVVAYLLSYVRLL